MICKAFLFLYDFRECICRQFIDVYYPSFSDSSSLVWRSLKNSLRLNLFAILFIACSFRIKQNEDGR